ncbi:class I SAM-dependent methyltransferase [Hansschlegelia zhihuaiae]|uniref:Class I SAM-dependent methyltransferase n=1 Tax=Hansschlegelia zhihuaiae TaxID=405005 RepID=A0A4Q0MI09_9HYPH|nr:class I SAM-dependent methyltransferase [Hansschlegelia zhihuaiae]RXF73251.1 class I SAM-dependent methyltransferase [Hansschlegelia zhihuaiae]
MKEVDFGPSFQYVGGDIVAEMIAANNAKYASPSRTFQLLDVINDPFPNVDLWFCRDLFFHLPIWAVKKSILNFCASDVKYILLTTHKNDGFKNEDTDIIGRFRRIDLFSPPYNFDREPLERFDDYIRPYPPREMCLFTRDQIKTYVGRWQG